MAAGVAIAKAVIEVKFDDLKKAQLALKKTGVEMIHFGEKAKKAKGGTTGLTKNIGDLSEALDKKLEQNLGRAFKATDRLQSIIGQMGAVVAVGTAVVGAFVLGYKLMSDALNTGAADIKRAEEGLLDMAQAADVAKGALADLNAAIANDEELSIGRAIRIAKVRQEIAVKSAQFELFMKQIAIAESEKVGFLEIDVRKKIAQAAAQINRSSFETAAEFRAQELRDLAIELKTVKDMGEDFVGPVISDAELARHQARAKINEAAAKKGRARVSKSAKQAGLDWAAAADFAAAAWGSALDSQLDDQEALREANRVFAESKAFADPIAAGVAGEVDALSAALGDLGKAFESVDTSVKPFVLNLSNQMIPLLEATGEAALSSAFDAIVYGESFTDQLNDFAEAQAKTAAISAAMELAKAAALALISPAQAGAHLAAAAAFGAAGALAGGVAFATGGFNGPSDGGDLGDVERESFTGAGNTGQDRDTGGGTQTTEVNVNLFAGSRPLLRIEAASMAQELRGILGAR